MAFRKLEILESQGGDLSHQAAADEQRERSTISVTAKSPSTHLILVRLVSS